jgi:anhydro-N-acetylmuramic acid kinase
MSGTSADGIDAVALRIDEDADTAPVVLAHHHEPYERAFRARLLELPDATPRQLALLHRELGERFADAALAAMGEAKLSPADVAGVCTPGHTVVHIPPEPGAPSDAGGPRAGRTQGATLALGDGDVIAERSGCTAITDVRAADRAAGGHGAPLVPWADAVLLRAGGAASVRAALNIGGIANLTVVPPRGDPIAFDTGPGNMIIDGAIARATQGEQTYDADGALGLAGTVDAAWLATLLAEDDFIAQPPPRSTGRERYGRAFLDRHAARLDAMSPPDIAATLSAYTVEAVVQALEEHVPQRPSELIVSGGGAFNRCLMGLLAVRLPDVEVTDSARALGIPVLAKEALAFALIGDATLRGLPSNVPSVTGARRPCVLGKISPAPRAG